ncbi:ABC transporter ATP-binding protein [Pararoseomonas indoligenes]|uniref:ABC transporter ATP-binding protein n=1 Tax=Roseomonas indoligenes TaxID=2820811 RepID=A0A940N8M1_9PROT|nr:ABC transporter ATP-binding protein [Pararoseomonas indoligenes]MBP0496057.1 ABC transporter ATP-binding protein [Pararoseomonas indoligenes]
MLDAVTATAAELTVEAVSLSFGGHRVLKEVSMDFRPGQVTGLIGPNGAGKTSLFNCLTGLYRPQQGRIALGGQSLERMPPARRARAGLSRSFQHVALCPELDVLENVMFGRARLGRSGWADAFLPLPGGRAERAEARAAAMDVLRRLDLAAFSDVTPAGLPPGTQRLVEIARAIASRPRVLLLDEPAAGLNPAETRQLTAVLRGLVSPELIIVVVEHDMDLIMQLCDRIHVLNFGQRIASGTPAEIRADPEVIRVYLGDSDD